MSAAREKAIRDAFGAFSRGDLERMLDVMTEDVVIDRRNSSAPWSDLRRGKAQARAALGEFVEMWTEVMGGIGLVPEEVRLVGRDHAATRTLMSGRGRTTGIDALARGGWMFRFDGDLVAEATLFQSFDAALLEARREALARSRLYFVCEGLPDGRDPSALLEAAIAGGVDVIQLREKAPRCAEELIALAGPFARAAREHGALFFLNDEPELVEACGADGVHVGQDDAPVADARAQAGPAALVGLSTHSPEQFDTALAAGGPGRPDQVSVGPVWETPTKEGRPATGLGPLRHAADSGAEVPWFAIGGIDGSNIGEVVRAGARRVVVVRAIRDASSPAAAARALLAALEAP